MVLVPAGMQVDTAIDRQTGRQTGEQTGWQKDRQKDRWPVYRQPSWCARLGTSETMNLSINSHFMSFVSTTKAAVHMGRRPPQRQSSDEQAIMDTDEHDAMFHKLNVLVQKLGHIVQQMVWFCHVEAIMLRLVLNVQCFPRSVC